MISPEVFKELVLGATAFAVGMSAITGVYNVVGAVRGRDGHAYALAAVRFGTAITLGLLGWALRNAPGIPPEAQAFGYIFGALLIAFGLIGVLVFRDPARQP